MMYHKYIPTQYSTDQSLVRPTDHKRRVAKLGTMFYEFAFFLVLSVASETCGDDGKAFECPINSFYSDVKGVYVSCSQFPALDSNVPFCFKDVWWKTAVYASSDQPPIDEANLYNTLDVPLCKKTCKCVMSLSIKLFDCIVHGRPPHWVDTLPLQQRTACNCRNIEYPDEIAKHAEDILLGVNLNGLSYDIEKRPALLEDLIFSFERMKIESFEITISTVTLGVDKVTSLTNFFTPGRLPGLVHLSIASATSWPTVWPDASAAIANITSGVMFLSIYDMINFTAIPKPSFVNVIRTLTCHGCASLKDAPVWIKDAPNLLFLHISGSSQSFPLSEMPGSNSLIHLSFTNTPINVLPNNFVPSKLYPNLENLDLGNLNLSIIPENIAQNLTKLQRLELSGNCLTPLPSFKGMSQLTLLNLDGYTVIYGSAPPHSPASPTCSFGPCSNLRIKESDLHDLVNLRTLSLSFYQNLQIDNDAFSNLRNLKRFSMDCTYLSRLPTALQYTCQLRWLSMRKNSFFNNTDVSNLDASQLPLFVPKFYNQLQELVFVKDLEPSPLKIIPPSLLLLNASKSSRLLQTLTYSITASSSIAANQCEMYKFETAYNFLPSTPQSFINSSAGTQCVNQYSTFIKLAEEAMKNVTNYCIPQSNAATGYSITVILTIAVMLGILA